MKIRIGLLLLMTLVLFRCDSGLQVMHEPSGNDSFLIIGAVALEDKYYSQYGGVHIKDIEVAILSETVIKDDLKISGAWTRTDENGFFCLSNVAPGRYEITGIRLYLSNGELLVLSNPLTSGSTEFMIQSSDHVPFLGQYFPTEPEGRIVNLKNNLFIVDQESQIYLNVKLLRQNTIVRRKMVDGSYLDMVPVADLFRDKYPTSRWIELLDQAEAKE